MMAPDQPLLLLFVNNLSYAVRAITATGPPPGGP
jgi:hypothetical protein